MPLNVEIKARSTALDRLRHLLETEAARFVGEDHQIDTYFRVSRGRLKLREGTIEHALIFYERADEAGPKTSRVHLYRPAPDPDLKALLTAALGVRVVVDKRRAIYFVENVKIHLDRVERLGTFVEIEAIDPDGTRDEAALRAQCEPFLRLFGIREEDLVRPSYSDLLEAATR